MTTSGITTYSLPVDELINDATEMIGGEPTLGNEAGYSSLRILNQLLIELQNRAVPLFSLERVTTNLAKNTAVTALASDTVDVLELTSRTPTRADGGVASSSAGGTADYAFDGDLSTSCTQTSADGNISYAFSGPTLIVTCGFISNTSTTYNLIFEVSDDGSTWETYYTVGSIAAVAGTYYTYDLATPAQWSYARLRETGGATLDMEEVYFFSSNQDLQMQRISYDTYITLPNKNQSGRPTQYYIERNTTGVNLIVWPVPSDSTYSVYYQRIRKLESVTALSQTIDMPYRFIPAIKAGLAYQLGMRRKDTSEQWQSRLQMVKAEYENQLQWALEEDKERVSTIIVPRMRLF